MTIHNHFASNNHRWPPASSRRTTTSAAHPCSTSGNALGGRLVGDGANTTVVALVAAGANEAAQMPSGRKYRALSAAVDAAGAPALVPDGPPSPSLVAAGHVGRAHVAAPAAFVESAEPCAVEWSVVPENPERIELDGEGLILELCLPIVDGSAEQFGDPVKKTGWFVATQGIRATDLLSVATK